MQRERVGRTALLPVWRDDGDVPHLPAHVGEQCQARGQHAVIVADQDVHWGLAGQRVSGSVTAQPQLSGAASPLTTL